jgi:hypothetical protein
MPFRDHRIGFVIGVGFVALAAGVARAQCPPSCAGGGGPAATDCYLAWGNAPGKVINCTDGDASCDVDGQLDGTCTFGLAACTNVAVGACSATPLDAPPTVVQKGAGGEALVTALGQLPTATSGCTESGLVKLAIAPSQTKLKPAKLTLRVTAVAGGKRDKDTFKLVCNPGRPSLATHVQPIFNASCIASACHAGLLPQNDLSLEAGKSAADLAETALASFPKIPRVKPRSLKKSYLTKSLFGNGAVQMPDGCPNAPVEPEEGKCLTQSQIYVILAWIQAGALP